MVALKRRSVGIEKEVFALGVPVYIARNTSRWRRLLFLRRTIESTRPDIVHSVIFEANVLLRLVRPFVRHRFLIVQSIVSTPYVAHRRIAGGRSGRFKFFLARWIDSLTARVSDVHYHGISQTVIDHYRPYYRFSPDKTTLAYRGRDAPSWSMPRLSDKDGYTLITVGRQVPEKGQGLIVEAMRLLRDHERIDNLRLRIYGRKGSATDDLRALVETADLEDSVAFMGFVANMDAAYREADIFVFPSYYEGMGGALIEAMAAGLPCVCSDIPVLREVIDHPNGALFFERGDARQLAERLEAISSDGALRQRLSELAKQRFVQTFTNEQSLGGIYDMYQRILPQ